MLKKKNKMKKRINILQKFKLNIFNIFYSIIKMNLFLLFIFSYDLN